MFIRNSGNGALTLEPFEWCGDAVAETGRMFCMLLRLEHSMSTSSSPLRSSHSDCHSCMATTLACLTSQNRYVLSTTSEFIRCYVENCDLISPNYFLWLHNSIIVSVLETHILTFWSSDVIDTLSGLVALQKLYWAPLTSPQLSMSHTTDLNLLKLLLFILTWFYTPGPP